MKPDKRLQNTKVYVAGKSAEIQKKAFELVYSWEYRNEEIVGASNPFLYFDKNGFISNGCSMDFFMEHEFSEITADEILAMEPESEPKHEFKPFDKVLVRSHSDFMWKLDLFSHFSEANREYPYVCIGSHEKFCIPFEGNEHLLGTILNKKVE